jgi:hypothetical protein
LRQGIGAFGPAEPLTARQTAVVRDCLNVPQLALFETMDAREKLHAARTALNLIDLGVDDGDVLVAALLHDAAKGRQRLVYRVAYVLLDRYARPLLQRMAVVDGWGPRGAFERSLHHAERSAELARAAGASERACRLIALHHRAGDEPGLAELIEADGRA